MARLTISLNDERHQALKEAAARRGLTIGQLIEASLEYYGIKTTESAQSLVQRAREASRLSEEDATTLAVDEARAVRTQ